MAPASSAARDVHSQSMSSWCECPAPDPCASHVIAHVGKRRPTRWYRNFDSVAPPRTAAAQVARAPTSRRKPSMRARRRTRRTGRSVVRDRIFDHREDSHLAIVCRPRACNSRFSRDRDGRSRGADKQRDLRIVLDANLSPRRPERRRGGNARSPAVDSTRDSTGHPP
jgi:hypothetical protein